MSREKGNLRVSNFSQMLDVSQIMVCDLTGVIQWWSQGLELLYGWKAEEVIGRVSQELLQANFPIPLQAIEAELKEKGSWTGEIQNRRQDGEWIWVSSHWTLQRVEATAPPVIVKTNNDITKLKQIEHQLERSEQRFRWLVESSPMPVGEVRYGGQVLRANNACLNLLGITREEFAVRGLNLLDATPPEWAESTWRNVKESFETRRPILYEKEYIRRDGTRVPIAVGLCWSEVATDEALAFIMDLTQQKRVEIALRRSEQRFRLVVETAPNGMLMVDMQGVIVLVNTQIERIFQYSREELIGKTVDSLLPERHRIRHSLWQKGFLDRPSARKMGAGRELFARRRDGTEFPVEIGLNPIETGEGMMVLSSIVDITDRRLAEQTLRESEQRFRTLVESIPGIVFTADAECGNNFTNAQFQRYTGLPAEQLLGDGWLGIVHPDDREHSAAIRAACADSGQGYESEHRFRRHDGVYRWHLGRGIPLHNAEGQVTGWFGIATDIEDQKRVAADLEALVRERTSALEAALAEKTVLLQEIHHRVKNNLAIISSLLGLEARNTHDAGASHGLEDSQRRVQAMAKVHEHLYRTEQLDRVNFADYIRQLAEELYASIVATPEQVKLRIEVEQIPIGVDRAIPCGLILSELLSNAFKYAFPKGRTGQVLVRLLKSSEDCVSLIVQDDGIGIPGPGDWRKAQTLGLRIVQVLTKQLDASLELQIDGGTKFQLIFPFRRQEHFLIEE